MNVSLVQAQAALGPLAALRVALTATWQAVHDAPAPAPSPRPALPPVDSHLGGGIDLRA